jgi:hypothetical protein
MAGRFGHDVTEPEHMGFAPRAHIVGLMMRANKLVATSIRSASSREVYLWFGLSMVCAAVFGLLGLREAFISNYVVQDDARVHVFWMQRFLEPKLFPHDVIADYFQSVAPFGYAALYRLMSGAGADPLLVSKLLPLVLGLVTSAYCFGVCMRMFHVPSAGFLATLLLNQNLWMKDDLVSATPRAFVYPLLLAFLYYLLGESSLPCVLAIALQGLFYPQVVFVSVGILILCLFRYENGRLSLPKARREYLLCATGLVVALLVLLPYAGHSSEFGPVITGSDARELPEFSPTGRTRFFLEGSWSFWLCGERSGVLPIEWCLSPLKPPQIFAGLALPILLLFPSRFPLVRKITDGIGLLPRIVLVSLGMFFLAHALLFKLHLPSRYTQHSLRVVMALAAGIALIVALDAVFSWSGHGGKVGVRGREFLALGTAALLGTGLVLYPIFLSLSNYRFPLTAYVVGSEARLYEFFAQQPRDIVIASLAEETNNLPTFSRRSILVGRKYAIPFHVGYYRQVRQRTADLLRAQYSDDLAEARDLIQTYGVNFWLLHRAAFMPEYVEGNPWFQQFQPTAAEAWARLKRGRMPALASVMDRCSVFETMAFVVLDAVCIVRASQE